MKRNEQLQELAAYQEFLRSASLDDQRDFQQAIAEAQDLLGLSQTDLAREFACTRATVNRWSQGTAVPYTGLRKVVFERLARRAGHRRRRLEKAQRPGAAGTPGYGTAAAERRGGAPVDAAGSSSMRQGKREAGSLGSTRTAGKAVKARPLVTAGIATLAVMLPLAA